MADPVARKFALDAFQLRAIEAFDVGESVLVSAPTGAGKTVIAEHAIESMLAAGRRVFYTSPIKALANQKFRDFGARFGTHRVGLLTGDVTIRSQASVVVMTTEVLRNMLYEGSGRIRQLGAVVLDEVHYLQDRQRGPVWEEVLLNLPNDVRTVSLSATVSNVEEFVEWLRTVRGPTRLIEERVRPVPLRHELAVLDRGSGLIERVPLLHGAKLSPQAAKYRPESRSRGSNRGRPAPARSASRPARRTRNDEPATPWGSPRRTDLIEDLIADKLGPLIWFIFSRSGCDEAVEQCRRAGLRYTDEEQADRLAAILAKSTADIDDDDWFSLELDDWQESFETGIASHHAGLIPAVKEAVETAFAEGLLSVVFATETLALGVNLPARTIVIEKLVKFNGETHELLTPLEFTQLAGRAGRRGLDTEGTAVSCWSARVRVDDVAALAASNEFPLFSAFTPNYNMVANLIRRVDAQTARSFVTRSFAQFQKDRTVVASESRHVQIRDQIAKAERDVRCDHGDVRAWLREREKQGHAGDEELGELRPGAVLAHGSGLIVVSVAHRGGGVVVRTIDSRGRAAEHRRGEFASPIAVLGHERLPVGLAPNSAECAAWAKDRLTDTLTVGLPGIESCPDLDRHLAAIRDIERLERKAAKLDQRDTSRQAALLREFDAVAQILHDRGFATDWSLTPKGLMLAGVHGETEAVLAEALDQQVFHGLAAAELAAALSALVYEPRGGGAAVPFRWPTRPVRHAAVALRELALGIRNVEHVRLDHFLTREPDPGLVDAVYGWALGDSLDQVLTDQLTGGDFVRTMRQVVDVCRQVAGVSSGDLSATANDAIELIDRGVVRSAYDLVEASTAEVGTDAAAPEPEAS